MISIKNCALALVWFLMAQGVAYGQSDAANGGARPVHVFYLLGDVGEGGTTVLEGLSAQLMDASEESSVVFLGNNTSATGMPKPKKKKKRAAAEKILDAQLNAVSDFKGNTYFIPGNKDWNSKNNNGRAAVRRQEDYLQSKNKDRKAIRFYPNNACGDPKVVEVDKHLAVLFLDTQWWLQDWTHEENINKGCKVQTRGEWLDRLSEIFTEYRHEQIIVFMHHPLHSNGRHGGQYSWKQHLFPFTDLHPDLYIPLPVVGSLYPLVRQGFGPRQDLDHPDYKVMRESILLALGVEKDNVVFVSAHDRSLQHHEVGGNHFVVSGSGSEGSYVRNGGNARFTSSAPGYAQLTFMDNGALWLKFTDASGTTLYNTPIVEPRVSFGAPATAYGQEFPDSVTFAAHAGYQTSGFGKLIMGKAYRDVWATPVKVPVLDLATYRGGYLPTKKGGGMASNSLRAQHADGSQLAIRSLNKDLSKVLPPEFRDLKEAAILRDQTSANFPYAPLPIKFMSDRLGIFHTNAKLYFMPKQDALGDYNAFFGGELYWVEERPKGEGTDQAHFGNSDKLLGYNDVLEKLNDKPHHMVDQRSVLWARLFDLFIHDWDRHDDQWRWAAFKEGEQTVYRPIPRDRDQAFHQMNGVLPSVAYTFFERKFVPFKKRFKAPLGHSFNARHFDRYFLTGLDRETWRAMAEEMAVALTDELIDSAMQTLPKEVIPLRADEFASKLKSRKRALVNYSQKLYRFLSRSVDVPGTDKEDLFEVMMNDDRTLTVKRSYRDKNGEKVTVFDRTFRKADTRSVHIYAQAGRDSIVVSGSKRSRVKLRVIGGTEADVLAAEAGTRLGRVEVYDDAQGLQLTTDGRPGLVRLNDNIGNNTYDRRAFIYDRIKVPISLGYTVDDGIWIGSGLNATIQGFRKLPYAHKHQLAIRAAPAGRQAFQINYDFDLTRVLFNTINIGASMSTAQPVYRSFFGYGNKTVETSADRRFNWVRMHSSNIHPFLRYQSVTGKHRVSIGPSFNANRIIRFPNRITEDSTSVFTADDFEFRFYAGVQAGYVLNTVDNELNPTRGFRFEVAPFWSRQIASTKSNYGFNSSLSTYMTFGRTWMITAATRVGFDLVAGDPELYHHPSLGSQGNLRGYRNDRFTGDKAFYTNFELRFPIVKWKNGLLPMNIGAIAGIDVGRVWYANEASDRWHYGYGGSLTFNLFDLILLSPTLSHSRDGLLFTFGTGYRF